MHKSLGREAAKQQMLLDDLAVYAKVAIWTSLIGGTVYMLFRLGLFALTVAHIAG